VTPAGRSALPRVQDHLDRAASASVPCGGERLAVLTQRVDVRDHLLEWRRGLRHREERRIEGVHLLPSKLLHAVPDEPLDLEFTRPGEGEVELGDLVRAPEHDDATAGCRVPQGLRQRLTAPDAVVDQGEASAVIDLVADDRRIRSRTRGEERVARLVPGLHDARRAERASEIGLLLSLRLCDDLTLEARFPDRPDRAEGDGAAADHEYGFLGVRRGRVERGVHSDRQRFGEHGGAIVDLIRDREELRLVGDRPLGPPPRQRGVVALHHARLHRSALYGRLALVSRAAAGRVEAVDTRTAPLVPLVSAHLARDHRVDGHALPDLDARHGRPYLDHPPQDLVSEHRREGAERLHRR